MNAVLNSQRWSIAQRNRARSAVSLPSVADERAAKLAQLRQSEALYAAHPHMASALAAVRAEIARLEINT